MQERGDSAERARECFARGDFADTVAWLRHWVAHDVITWAGAAEDTYRKLVRDLIADGNDLDRAAAAIDYGASARVLSRWDVELLRAGHRIVRGDIETGLAMTLPLLLRRDSSVKIALAAVARFLDTAGRADLARRYRLHAEDLEREEATPAEVMLNALAQMPLLNGDAEPERLPNPRLDRLCATVLAQGHFAAAYVPYADSDGRTADGAEDVAAFDDMCAEVEKALSLLDSTMPALYVVPADPPSLRAFADARGDAPDDPWTATLWAGQQAADGRGRPWPPEPHDPCWCGRPRLYDDCCRWRDGRS